MERIELHDVEYGDCTVLVGRSNSILMVDCGSVSRYTRQGETCLLYTSPSPRDCS